MRGFYLLILISFIGTCLSQADKKIVLEKKKHYVYATSFSPDGEFLTTGGDDGDIVAWKMASRTPVAEYNKAHDKGAIVLSVAYSPNLVHMATGGLDGKAIVWNIQSQVVDKFFVGHQAPVTAVVFSNDGRFLYTGSADQTIGVWDLTKNMKVAELRGHSAEVSGLAIHPEQQILASSSYDGMVYLWDLEHNKLTKKLDLKGKKVRAVDFSNDGENLVAAFDDKSLRMIDVSSQRVELTLRGHKDVIYDIEFSPDGQYIFSGSLDNSIKVWSTASGEEVKHYEDLDHFVGFALSSNGKHMAVAQQDQVIQVFDIADLEIKPALIKPVEVYNEVGEVKRVVVDSKYNTSKPELKLVQPAKSQIIQQRGTEVFLHMDKDLEVIGELESKNGIYELYIDGVEVPVTHGHFKHKMKLAYGNNDIEIIAIDIYDNIDTSTLTVQRQVLVEEYNDSIIRSGQDYALVICTDEYNEFPNLKNPIFDGESIKSELERKYGFEVELLKNPTKTDILKAVKSYSKKAYAKDDQLLIFIAGHGEYDADFDQGYLVTTDSRRSDEVRQSFLAHSNLGHLINRIPCEHILLVMDACFSGTFGAEGRPGNGKYKDKNELLEQAFKFKTRRFVTSGGKEYVSDGGAGEHSPFAAKFIKALSAGGGKDGVLTFGEVFAELEFVKPGPRTGVFGSNQTGSEFIFSKNK